MARITKNAHAPVDAESVSLGQATFDFDSNGGFDSDDPTVVSNARANPFLDVEEDVVDEGDPTTRADYDPNDPHDNPSADHLATEGSQAARDAAEANEEAVRESVGLAVPADRTDDPTVEDTLNETFDVVAADGNPKLPEASQAVTPVSAPPRALSPVGSSSDDGDGED